MTIDYEKELGTIEIDENTEDLSDYAIDETLAGLKYEYDLNALYIPIETRITDNIPSEKIEEILLEDHEKGKTSKYLKISRDKNKQCELQYSWVRRKGRKDKGYTYKELQSFTRKKIILAEDTEKTGKNSIVGKLVATGSQANIEVTTEDVQKFIIETFENIISSEKLDVLKKKDYVFLSVDENDESISNEIDSRINPKLTDEQKREALEVEKQIATVGFVQYMNDVLEKVHIGDNKSIIRALLGEFSIIKGWNSFLIMSTGGAEAGKSFEAELSLDFIPRQYIFKVNDMTKASFTRYSETHEAYFNRLLCVFGDLGSQKAFSEMEDVFNIMKILITENEYSRTLSDKVEGSYENVKLDLNVDSVGAIFQTTAFDFLDIEGEQLASRTIKLTPADANEKKVLEHIFTQIGFNSEAKTNKKIAEAKAEINKFQSYILHLVSEDVEIINPWFSVFERFVEISNTPYRDMKQILFLFKAYCTMTHFKCEQLENEQYLATKEQLETFLNEISLKDALPPLESEFLKMLIGKGTKIEMEIEKAKSDTNEGLDMIDTYFEDVYSDMYDGVNGDNVKIDIEGLSIESLNEYQTKEFIATLLKLYRLKGRSEEHKKNVFFTVSDVKYAYSNKKAYKNVNDIPKMLNKLYKMGFIDKLDYKDGKGQNIYYLTSKCENIVDTVIVTETDEAEARKKLHSELGVKT